MPHASSTSIQGKQIERSILKSAKKVIAESGIDPSTRSGNKELDYVVKLLAKQPFSNLAAATRAGEELGQKVVELSQKMGRKYLDRGVIRQLLKQKDLPTVTEASPSATQDTAAKASSAMAVSPPPAQAENPEPIVQPAPVPIVTTAIEQPETESLESIDEIDETVKVYIPETIVEPIEADEDEAEPVMSSSTSAAVEDEDDTETEPEPEAESVEESVAIGTEDEEIEDEEIEDEETDDEFAVAVDIASAEEGEAEQEEEIRADSTADSTVQEGEEEEIGADSIAEEEEEEIESARGV